jgi:hypothetical protein
MDRQKYNFHGFTIFSAVFTLFLSLFFQVPTASAVPSYARQTGFPCKSCHMMPPELTALGRAFKLNGYTLVSKPTITSTGTKREGGLAILESFPLSALFDTSFSATKSPQPGTQNGSFEFPQDASLFLAGEWTPHVGSFIQVTYETQGDNFSWDNTDIRYANSTKLFQKDLAYGITLNNNPTVEDLWNSTPAWGFPPISSGSAPSPNAAALINGTLGMDVAGVGGYAMWNNHLYIAGTIYRSEHIGVGQPLDGLDFPVNIRGVAPYWRVAWQQTSGNNSLMVGTYGMHVKSSPEAITGPEDSFTDWAFDFQYDRAIPRFGGDVLSLRGTYIRENSSFDATSLLDGATPGRHHLNTIQANAEYHFGNKLSGTFGFFNVDGTSDPLLFPSGDVTGNANGDPKSTGFIGNVSWWPIQNVGLTFQYTGYTRFNGGRTDYDGAGRNAGSNNTIFVLARFVF